MNSSSGLGRGMYFEEFEVGQRFVTSRRTITEADIVVFAGLTGDFNAIHTDKVYASQSTFGRRVVHGLLGLSIAAGLAVQTGILEGTVLAFREVSNWRFSLPIFINDTIQVLMEVEQTKAMPRLGGGACTLSLDVLNQEEQSVMKGRWTVLVRGKEDS